MEKKNCKTCNCICHCNTQEHSDLYGVCSCEKCACNASTIGGVVVDETEECETCQ